MIVALTGLAMHHLLAVVASSEFCRFATPVSVHCLVAGTNLACRVVRPCSR
ncbi:hypothetical protein BVRB_4g084320 [Beta vulgaris subsp. vulgaris]|nr:hypothetical protein BVRB_4g084320 [Beta vulgaris subsp. vulgaris]